MQGPNVTLSLDWMEVSNLFFSEFPVLFSFREYVSLLSASKCMEAECARIPETADSVEINSSDWWTLALEAQEEFPRFLEAFAAESARFLLDPNDTRAVDSLFSYRTGRPAAIRIVEANK